MVGQNVIADPLRTTKDQGARIESGEGAYRLDAGNEGELERVCAKAFAEDENQEGKKNL